MTTRVLIPASTYEGDGETTIFGYLDLAAVARTARLPSSPAWDFLAIERADRVQMHGAVTIRLAGKRMLANCWWGDCEDGYTPDIRYNGLDWIVDFYGAPLFPPWQDTGGGYINMDDWTGHDAQSPLMRDAIPLIVAVADAAICGDFAKAEMPA